MSAPSPLNDFHALRVKRILDSYHRLTGHELLSERIDPVTDAMALYEAPFAVACHGTQDDPLFNYGNKTMLRLFEMTWESFIGTPSRKTAEAVEREERQRLLDTVSANGFVDDYAGVRITSAGNRFFIERATVWNVAGDTGELVGQAASFSKWNFL